MANEHAHTASRREPMAGALDEGPPVCVHGNDWNGGCARCFDERTPDDVRNVMGILLKKVLRGGELLSDNEASAMVHYLKDWDAWERAK